MLADFMFNVNSFMRSVGIVIYLFILKYLKIGRWSSWIKGIRWITWGKLTLSHHSSVFRIIFIGNIGFILGFGKRWWGYIEFFFSIKFTIMLKEMFLSIYSYT